MSQPLPSPVERHNARAVREGWPTVCDDKLVFTNPRLGDLVSIWTRVRGARLLPLRSDFSARALARHLKDIAFLERLAPADGAPRRYRYGFFGSELARYTGDFTGRHLDEMIPAPYLPAWTAACDTVLEQHAPLRFVSLHRSLGLDYLIAECLVAPLGDADGRPTGILSSIVYTPRVT